MNVKIPLFPLKLVVFPGSRYPLHIFEPRYKILINESLKRDTGFGIVALFDNKISDVCTYVKIEQVLKNYPNGESDIIIFGVSRYLIHNVEQHGIGYLIGDAEIFEDFTDEINHDKEIQLIILFEELLNKLNYNLSEGFWDNLRRSRFKSFKIAEKAGLSLEQQQELLILKSENERLNYLIKHLTNLENAYTEKEIVRNLINQNGYLNENNG